MLGFDEDIKLLSGENCNTPNSLTSKVGKIKINLYKSYEYTTINFNLNILTNGLDQTKLISQLTYRIMIGCVQLEIMLEQVNAISYRLVRTRQCLSIRA